MNHRGIKLINNKMKLLKRVIEHRSRDTTSVTENWVVFIPDRSTTDGILFC